MVRSLDHVRSDSSLWARGLFAPNAELRHEPLYSRVQTPELAPAQRAEPTQIETRREPETISVTKTVRATASIQGTIRCPFCHDGLLYEDAKRGCGACLAWHHAECWLEARGCSSCSSSRGGGSPAVRVRGPQTCGRERCSAPALLSIGSQPLCEEHSAHSISVGVTMALSLASAAVGMVAADPSLVPALMVPLLLVVCFVLYFAYQAGRRSEAITRS